MVDRQDAWDSRRMLMTVGPGPVSPAVLVALVGIVVAVAGAVLHTRRLESVEHAHALSAAELGAWARPVPGAPFELALGSHALPVDGLLRVSVCAVGQHPPALALLVARPSMAVASVPLTADESRGDRCVAAEWRSPTARRVTARLKASTAPPLRAADVRAGGRLSPRIAWPMVLLLLSLGVLVFARTDTDRWPAPTDASRAIDPWQPAMVVAPWVVLVALLGVNLIVPLCAAVGHGSTHAILYGLLLQHGSLACAAALFLGAFGASHPRDALGLGPLSRQEFTLTLGAAVLLVAVALVTTLGIHDAGDTPIGQDLASVPLRYAIVFGALGAPIAEELFFRGALVSALGRRSVYLGVWASALVFTAMHMMQLAGAWLGLVPIALLGVTNGYLRVYTRGLTAPWLVHTLYNTLIAAPVFFAS